MTILLPELTSDQAVRLAFTNFGEVVSVFKGRHKFNGSETEKEMLESSKREDIQRYCQRKFLSIVISKEMSFLRKRWFCATGAKLGTCLARIAL